MAGQLIAQKAVMIAHSRPSNGQIWGFSLKKLGKDPANRGL
jgi:hypothetical protein